jgi:cellulose biosynthesis protein BcsQ
MPHAAFIAAAPADQPAALIVRNALAAQGLSVWLAGDDLRQEQFLPQLNQAVADSRCVVALLSSTGEQSEWLRRELVAALNNAKPIIPVLIDDVRPDGWLRLMIAPDDQIDARGGLGPAVLDSIINAVRSANSAGRVIAMLNIKGGVGKTVLAANLFTAAHLVDNRSIVFVDLDPQHNLSQYFLPPVERNRMREDSQTIYSVFASRGEHSAKREAFAAMPAALNRAFARNGPRPRLDLMVGDERLFEYTLDVKASREKEEAYARFHALIAQLRARYDAVVIDTNPCATFLTRCAVAAADHIVAPVRPEKYSLSGLNMLEWVTRELRERPVKPQEFSVILNGVGDRVRSRAADVDAQTRNEIAVAPFFGSALLKTAIPYSGLLRATPDDRYAINPINVTAIMRLAQRSLKEALTDAAAEVLKRAAA